MIIGHNNAWSFTEIEPGIWLDSNGTVANDTHAKKTLTWSGVTGSMDNTDISQGIVKNNYGSKKFSLTKVGEDKWLDSDGSVKSEFAVMTILNNRNNKFHSITTDTRRVIFAQSLGIAYTETLPNSNIYVPELGKGYFNKMGGQELQFKYSGYFKSLKRMESNKHVVARLGMIFAKDLNVIYTETFTGSNRYTPEPGKGFSNHLSSEELINSYTGVYISANSDTYISDDIFTVNQNKDYKVKVTGVADSTTIAQDITDVSWVKWKNLSNSVNAAHTTGWKGQGYTIAIPTAANSSNLINTANSIAPAAHSYNSGNFSQATLIKKITARQKAKYDNGSKEFKIAMDYRKNNIHNVGYQWVIKANELGLSNLSHSDAGGVDHSDLGLTNIAMVAVIASKFDKLSKNQLLALVRGTRLIIILLT